MQKQIARIEIPDNVSFADLRLSRDSDGHVSFDWSPIDAICKLNQLAIDLGIEDNVAGLIIAWYHAHLESGGDRNATADDLIAEVITEDAAGQPFSFPPGRA
jgi:hypothetical protein